MTDTVLTPPVPAAIPWYKSNVLRSLLVITVTRILARFHIAGTPGDVVDTIYDVIDVAAAVWAAYSRTQHPMPAITTTQEKANEINSPPTV